MIRFLDHAVLLADGSRRLLAASQPDKVTQFNRLARHCSERNQSRDPTPDFLLAESQEGVLSGVPTACKPDKFDKLDKFTGSRCLGSPFLPAAPCWPSNRVIPRLEPPSTSILAEGEGWGISSGTSQQASAILRRNHSGFSEQRRAGEDPLHRRNQGDNSNP